ncbi:Crotonobetainyl-CoA reductase [Streptomyces tendae]
MVAPKIGDFYERHEFPYEIVREMGRMGLFGLPFPEEYGGMGGDYFALGVALEELARIDSSVAITLEAGVSLGAMPLHLFGTEEQKRQWLPRLCSGEILGAFGLSQDNSGSDAGATRTTARLDEATDEWVINGTKCFITNSGTDITGLVTVAAVTGRKPDGRPLISSIIVPSGTPGFTVAAPYSKVGWNASDTRELSFADVRVPAAKPGRASPDDVRAVMRSYTLRALRRDADGHTAEIDVDFVLHGVGLAGTGTDGEPGPAARWAADAAPGDRVLLLGPAVADNRAIRFRLPEDTDLVVIWGDATAVPAACAIVEALPAGTPAGVWLEVPHAEDVQDLETAADAEVTWLVRDAAGGPGATLAALREARLPPAGHPYVWIAGESGCVRSCGGTSWVSAASTAGASPSSATGAGA